MKPTPQQSTSERLGVINLLLCQASFLHGRHTNKGMKLVLTKEEAWRERKGDWEKEKKTCTTSQKIKEKTSRRLNLEVLLRTRPSLVQTQLNFFYVSTALLRRFLPLKMLIFLYWSISRERCSRVDWSLTLSGSYLPHIWKLRGERRDQQTCPEFFSSLRSNPLASAAPYDRLSERFKALRQKHV